MSFLTQKLILEGRKTKLRPDEKSHGRESLYGSPPPNFSFHEKIAGFKTSSPGRIS